jgi:hypothetical protein
MRIGGEAPGGGANLPVGKVAELAVAMRQIRVNLPAST